MDRRTNRYKYRLLGRGKRNIQMNIRFTDSEIHAIREKANRYCEGKVPEWVRYAATMLMPRRCDLIDKNDTLTGENKDESQNNGV